VEHRCHHCGATVEEGVPFCPQCKAPQIRVLGSSPSAESSPPSGVQALPIFYSRSLGSSVLEWSEAVPAAAKAGLIGAILMVTPFGILGLGMVTAGILAVLFYRRRVPHAALTTGLGVRLGALSGVLGFGILIVLVSLGTAIFHFGPLIHQRILEAVQQAASRSSDPQAQQAVELMKTPEGLALFLAFALVLTLIACLIFSALGGTIGTALLKRKGQP
jgi:zinc-ribbon domain